MPSLYEWFDPYNTKHLEALHTIQELGEWPSTFLQEMDEERVDRTHWSMLVRLKIADAWLAFYPLLIDVVTQDPYYISEQGVRTCKWCRGTEFLEHITTDVDHKDDCPWEKLRELMNVGE